MTWTILSMIAAVACYACSQSLMHGRFRWQKRDEGFFGAYSWWRKYKRPEVKAPKNLYYKLIGVHYKERWPTSTWLTVAFTDLYHLSQMLFKLFLALSFAPLTGWIWAGVIWLTLGISFTIFYRILSR